MTLSAASGCGPFEEINDNFSEVSCFKGLELVSIEFIAETCASTEHSLNVRVKKRNAKALILRQCSKY